MLKKTLCFSLFFYCSFFANDRVAAVVGNSIILESAVQEQVGSFLANNPPTLNREDVEKKVLNYLIEQEVLVYFAKKDTLLSVSPEQVSSIVGERLSFFEQQLGSVAALEDYFGTSFLDIKETLEKEAKNMLLGEAFKQKLFSYVSISNTEVIDFYSAYKDSLPLTPALYDYSCIEKKISPSAESLSLTRSIADSIFSKISSKISSFDSFYSVYSGGDLGVFRRGTFIPEFEEVAFSLKEGEVSSPVQSRLGLHLIRLNSRVGEKIDVSHILFPLSITEKDVLASSVFLENIKAGQPNTSTIDSLSLSFKGSYGGVFFGVPKENINSLVLEKLDLLSTNKKPLSDVFKIDDSSFLLLHLKAIHPPQTPDLYEFWGFIEGLALERKFYSFYDDWYAENKKKVYIKIN